MLGIVSKIDKILAAFENSFIILLLTIMITMAFLQVLLRNLFDTGILWGDIFLRHLVLWVGFIGASLATREDKHISIDILSRITSKKIMPYIKIIVDTAAVIVCIILAKAAFVFVKSEYQFGSILFENIPSWIFQAIIPIGFAMIGLRFILKIIEQIVILFAAPRVADNNS